MNVTSTTASTKKTTARETPWTDVDKMVWVALIEDLRLPYRLAKTIQSQMVEVIMQCNRHMLSGSRSPTSPVWQAPHIYRMDTHLPLTDSASVPGGTFTCGLSIRVLKTRPSAE